MRVLHVNASIDPVAGGGAAERTTGLCRALSALGVHTSLLTLDLGLDRHVRRRLDKTEVHALRCLNRRFYLPEWAPRRVEAAVDSADVVHLTGHWTALNALAFRAARRTNTPHVVCPAGALPVFGRSARLKRSYDTAVGRAMVRSAAAHIAITETERASFATHGVDPACVEVIPNGVSPDASADPGAAARAELGQLLGGDSSPYVLFMGRLNPIKGPDLLLSAAAAVQDRLGDLRIVLAGPDEGMGAELHAQAEATGLASRVILPGALQGPVKAAAYRGARLLVVPSRQEAMSMVAIEAGAAGTPVLLTEACGFHDVERVGGGRVVATTVDGLAGGLDDLLGRLDKLPELGLALQRHVLEHYTWERAARSYLATYHRITACTPDPLSTEGRT